MHYCVEVTHNVRIPFYSKLSITFADDEFGEKTVSILLDGEESEMVFIDHPSIEMSVSTYTYNLYTNRKQIFKLIYCKKKKLVV